MNCKSRSNPDSSFHLSSSRRTISLVDKEEDDDDGEEEEEKEEDEEYKRDSGLMWLTMIFNLRIRVR